MLETDYFTGLTTVRELLVARGLTTADEYNEVLRQARNEVAIGKVTWPVYIAYGQR